MSDRPQEDAAGAGPWIEGAALAVLVALTLTLGGEAATTSYHGLLHSTLGEAVLRDGLWPENPYHAGSELRYYTLYPLLGAVLGKVVGGSLVAFAMLNAIAALLFPVALDALGRALSLSRVARRGCFLGTLLLFNAAGWIGYATMEHAELGDSPAQVLRTMTFNSEAWSLGWDTRLQAFLPKFLNVSSYALALPFGLWLLAAAARAGRRDSPPPWRMIPPATLALALNPMVGAFAGLCAVVWLLPTWNEGRKEHRLQWAAAGAISVVLALPFVWPLLGPEPGGEKLFQLGERQGHALTNVLGPLLLLGVFGGLGLRGGAAGLRWKVGSAVLIAIAIAASGRMAWGNEYKLVRMAAILLAIPAGVWIAGQRSAAGWRRWIPWACGVFALPTTLLVALAYARWELPADLAEKEAVPDAVLQAEAAAPDDAVLVLFPFEPRFKGRPPIQGHPLAPRLRHSLFVDFPHFHNDGIEDLLERLDLATALWQGVTAPLKRQPQTLDPALALQRIRKLVPGRTLLVLGHDDLPDLAPVMAAASAEKLCHEGGFTLWSLARDRP